MARSKGRRGKQARRANETRTAQRAASQREQISPAQYRFRRAAGWSLVAVGGLIGVVHWVGHLGFFGAPPGVALDLAAGYPMATALGVAGTIVLSKA